MTTQATMLEDLQAQVRAARRLLPRGGGTKPALSTPAADITPVEMSALSGIIEYEPSEYTFTAYAGTPLSMIVEELARHGQYLPFDPPLVRQGATLGGTVAANLSGPGRYRYGGVRDFILGVRFIDGQGRLVRGGGKVVKNAAGFDLPKFMVGSLGRYGLLVDFSFKVFPQPPAYVTLHVLYPDMEAALQAVFHLATQPFDLETLDLVLEDEQRFALQIRLGGLPEVLPQRRARLQQHLEAETRPLAVEGIEQEAERTLWEEVNRFAWAGEGHALIKIPLAPRQVPTLEARLQDARRRYSAGGNVAWVSTPQPAALEQVLTDLGLVGLQLWGPPGRPILGVRKGLALAQRVKRALDPDGKFLEA